MTTDPLPLTANWLLNRYVNDVNAIRFDDERLCAIDAAINEHNVAIEALKAERGALHSAQEKRIDALNTALCERLHVKLDPEGYPVARQGAPRKTKAAEPPALTSPTPDPILANLVADAERMLAAPTLDLADPTVTVAMMSLATPAGEAPTAADAFIADVSEPEKRLLENGFSKADIASTPIAEQWRLHGLNTDRRDVRQLGDGTWYEPITPPPDPIENEDAPF